MFNRLVVLSVVFTFSGGTLLSQSSAESRGDEASRPADTIRVYRLPEIVVTASRIARPYAETGRSVTVLQKQEMQSLVPLSAGEVLAQTEGAYVVGAGQNPGMLQSLFLRGAGNNQTALFVDDVRLTDPSSVNGALDLSELSLGGVERVEIVRGSHSTLYGSSALGGVVNLITEQPKQNGLGINTGLTGGAFGPHTSMFNQLLSLSYLHPTGVYAMGELNNASSRGLDATLDTVSTPGAFKKRDRDNFQKTDLFTKLGYADSRFNLHLSARTARQKADIDDGAYVDDDNYTLAFRRTLYTYGASYKPVDGFELKYVGGRSWMGRDAVDDSSVVDASGATDGLFAENHWSGSTISHELQLVTGPMDGARGILGFAEYTETMSSRSFLYWASSFGVYERTTSVPVQKSRTRSLFLHGELEGSAIHSSLVRFTLTGGVRFSRHSSFGEYTTFEINPAYRITDHGLLFGSITTGFNAPSLYQLYEQDPHYISGITLGNRQLRPERSISAEAGLRQDLLDGFTITAVAFQTVTGDAIEFVYLWDKNIGLDTLGNDWMRDDFRGSTYLNLGQQRTRGFEVSARYRGRVLEAVGQFTLLRGTISYSPEQINTAQTQGHHVQLYANGEFLTKSLSSTELVRRPRVTASIRLTCRVAEGFDTHLLIRYAGARPDVFYDSRRGPYGALATRSVARYTLVDLSQRIKVTDGLSVVARVENVFGTRYQEIHGFSTRGRGFYLNINYSASDALAFLAQ